jgi:hypothetical protein
MFIAYMQYLKCKKLGLFMFAIEDWLIKGKVFLSDEG